ncbi:MAG: response regulator transcription factor [Leptothrix ochracea]|jgi:two-component system OmpR family response regulator|uniref:response regulator transcription factor n=1 Tax=Leptothrix ochracea TaxID=735331 RepID=UPI0034E1B583
MRTVLAEDDVILADALSANLRHAGFEVEVATNGAVAEYLLTRPGFDLGIIDLGLPLVDGLTVVQRVRAARPTLPLVILTALDGMENRVAGLNAGADDYLTKPFDFPELEARIRALLRRAQAHGSAALPIEAAPNHGADAKVHLGGLVFDREAHRASVRGQMIDLSPREWLLLDLLVSHVRKVISKEQIAQVWSADMSESGGPASLEVYIHRVRRKLEGSGMGIRTVRGLGYLLETQD